MRMRVANSASCFGGGCVVVAYVSRQRNSGSGNRRKQICASVSLRAHRVAMYRTYRVA